ncbi:Nucleolar protein 13 [Recurvomyces mirabilis]|uniref:Nucleolar protein 13 n=1 Tax=Recurvomyces mirabilis TaxID=574656 RepID=A0AAE1C5F9_9PEZI|nr:Nucleolar protein 13 [Recurvomyces mirabilis]KAK5161254.1 Nucleolar protein 13 [Recurvomyces mirabilis]
MSSSSPEAEKKRKRTITASEDELEIDVNLPEPPSKKAKRAEKKKGKSNKSKTKTTKPSTTTTNNNHVATSTNDNADLEDETPAPPPANNATGRSDFGIWIGNLPFTTTKDSLRDFFKTEGKIAGEDVVRLHMPVPSDKRDKATNKGFAYVDFSSQEVLEKAMALTEYMLQGRRVLIKNAKSFEGRPAKVAAGVDGNVGNGVAGAQEGEDAAKPKEPARRVFVGNLGFDVTKEDLAEHFGLAGEVEDIHMATFEDSGKCKGFAWVRFVEAKSARAVVRGFVYVKAESEEDESEEEEEEEDGGAEEVEEEAGQDDGEGNAVDRKKKKKKKNGKKSGSSSSRRNKKHLNRLHGRDLRCEIAEDSQTRYKKRFGKKDDLANAEQNGSDRARPARSFDRPAYRSADGAATAPSQRQQRPDKDQRRDDRRKRHDARTVAPGKALADAPRATGAIVEGKGRRVALD